MGYSLWKTEFRRTFYSEQSFVCASSVHYSDFSRTVVEDIAGFVLFTRKFCVVQDFNSRTLIGAGKEQDGVYHYKGVVAAHSGRAGSLTTRELWHRRLGHPSSAVLSVLSHVGSFSRNSEDSEKVCDVCIRSK